MGGALLVVLSLRMTGGFDTVRAGLGAVSGEYTSLTSSTGIEVLLGYGLPMAVGLISGPFGDQCFWQRAFAIRRDRIGRSFFAGALLFAPRTVWMMRVPPASSILARRCAMCTSTLLVSPTYS